MVKDTAKIVEELALCDDFKTFYDENRDYMPDYKKVSKIEMGTTFFE